jgi:hypothetical protein
MNKKLLLIIGAILIVYGIFKPDISGLIPANPNPVSVSENYVIDAPSSDSLLEDAKEIIQILEQSGDSTKKTDCLKLSSLYADMSVLIELDQADKVIADTANIRTANSLAGKMLRLNIKDKYPGLADAAKKLVSSYIGEDDVSLDDELRSKSVEVFRALSWAFYEGSK